MGSSLSSSLICSINLIQMYNERKKIKEARPDIKCNELNAGPHLGGEQRAQGLGRVQT